MRLRSPRVWAMGRTSLVTWSVGLSSSSCCPFINNLVGEAVPFAAPSFRSLSDPSDRGGLYRFESDRGCSVGGGGANRGNEPLRTAAPFFSEPFK